MTDQDVHSAFVQWLAGVTGKTVIKAHQGGDRPPLPYLMVNLTTIAEVREHEQETEYSEDGASERILAKPVIETEWMFSVHAYGPNPSVILRPLRSAEKLAQVNEPLMPGLLIFDTSPIRIVPEFVNQAWEPRANMDFFLRGLVRDGHLIDSIETYGFDFSRK